MTTIIYYQYDCCNEEYRWRTQIGSRTHYRNRAKEIEKLGTYSDSIHSMEHPECPRSTIPTEMATAASIKAL